MHVMFIHPNFPAQFGHVAQHLVKELGWQATCVTSIDTSHLKLPFNHLNYKLKPGPTPKVFYNPPNLQGMLDHLAAVYRALKSVPQVQPDLVVGHVSYGTMLYLKTLYRCPFVGYFELLPPPFWSDELSFRKDFPAPESARLFNAVYHTLTHLHLNVMDAGYVPTHYQLSTAPQEHRHKLRVIFDGVDTEIYAPRQVARPVAFRGVTLGRDVRVVTYVSRGLESLRGFDVFMKMAKRIYRELADVVFLIAGEERTNYGHEAHYVGKQTFKQWTLAQDDYDLSRFHFLGRIPPTDLATLYQISDLHVYLTVPYVLSWSMVQAMSAGCRIVSSATAPVLEVMDHEVHGRLADFYDVDGLADQALRILRDPAGNAHLGVNARQRVLERYEKRKCIGQLVQLFKDARGAT